MTSRERVMATIAREPVDRVPIDVQCTRVMEERLISDLGLVDVNGLRERFGADIVTIRPAIKNAGFGNYYGHWFPKQIDQNRFIDNWGITWQKTIFSSGDIFYDVVDSPLKNLKTVKDLEEWPWPNPAEDWDFSTIKKQALEHKDMAIAGKTSAVFDDTWRLRGLENFMMDMAINPDFVHALLRKVCDYWLEYGRLVLEAAEGTIDLMWTCDDLGGQKGLLMSPDMCREYIMPLIRERADLFKSYGTKVMMHCCGGIYPVIGDIIQSGVDVLNPIQTNAYGMDRKRLNKEFGSCLVFHGSVDQQKALVFGSVDDVVKETKECLSVLGKGGGYIVAASHRLEADIPTENVVAMFDTAREYRQ